MKIDGLAVLRVVEV